jgi:anti-sigma regulatory factor (Ser/Thr protein kinase)
MFQENLTQETIEQQLQPVISVLEETVIPNQVELLQNNTYTLNYAWMYSFEKRLKYRIQDLLGYKLNFNQEKILFGVGGVVSEGLSNAFVHGHKKNPSLPISVWVSASKKGLGFSITDQGTGFDFEAILQSYRDGKSFYHIAGNGFPLLSNSMDFSACFQKNGTQLCLIYHLDKN